MKIRTAAIVALISSGTVAVAFAQGSITQDPGSMAPGNLTLDQLGPSTASPAIGDSTPGAGAMPTGTSRNMPRDSATGAGSGVTVFHGTPGAYGSSIPPWPGPPPIPPSGGGRP
ncbi:MAG TPA: hypothetical protein VGF39_12180 [Stellaceae bacterium]